jgi:hypothetical protein
MKFPAFLDATRTLRDWSIKLTKWRDEFDARGYEWQNWDAFLTGFSADPTDCIYRYTLLTEKTCLVTVRQATAGTSNATTFTISLPFKAASIPDMQWRVAAVGIVDNGSSSSNTGMIVIESGAEKIDLYTSGVGGGWTASNGKRFSAFQIMYERE